MITKKKLKENISLNLQKRMDLLDYSPKQLAEETGISIAWIKKVLNQENQWIQLQTILKFCPTLACNMEYLIGQDKPFPPYCDEEKVINVYLICEGRRFSFKMSSRCLALEEVHEMSEQIGLTGVNQFEQRFHPTAIPSDYNEAMTICEKSDQPVMRVQFLTETLHLGKHVGYEWYINPKDKNEDYATFKGLFYKVKTRINHFIIRVHFDPQKFNLHQFLLLNSKEEEENLIYSEEKELIEFSIANPTYGETYHLTLS